MWALVLMGFALAAEVSDHTLVYYNARMALREGRPLEATQLWLLRNALEDETGQVSLHDDDFGSVTWVALGALGLCQDGQPTDEDGAGLWPLAMHNWVVRNRSQRRRNKPPRPFDAFQVGRQQRLISIGDVLGSEELRTVELMRGGCLRHRLLLLANGEALNAKLSDAPVTARLLVSLLERAKTTVGEEVHGRSVIDARLFDLHLQLTEYAARDARRTSRETQRRGQQAGLSSSSLHALDSDAEPYSFAKNSVAARILEESEHWAVAEWMALSPARRAFIYANAQRYLGKREALDAVALAVIDQLAAAGEGADVQDWIGFLGTEPQIQAAVWSGERGRTLMALDADTGFRERSVIALHRGVRALEAGELGEALRAFAYAVAESQDSSVGDEVRSLSLRWLTYVASQYALSDALLLTLQQLLPRQEYSALLEDLMWSAALRADRNSFERGRAVPLGRGALERRLTLLQPLAAGNVDLFMRTIRQGLVSSPNETLRLIQQICERIELEDAEVRRSHIATLKALRPLLEPLAATRGRQARLAAALLERSHGIVAGLGGVQMDSDEDRARALDPDRELYAGHVRMAPSDPLPWPFRAVDRSPPSAFVPLELTPVEWREEDRLIFGWNVEG